MFEVPAAFRTVSKALEGITVFCPTENLILESVDRVQGANERWLGKAPQIKNWLQLEQFVTKHGGELSRFLPGDDVSAMIVSRPDHPRTAVLRIKRHIFRWTYLISVVLGWLDQGEDRLQMPILQHAPSSLRAYPDSAYSVSNFIDGSKMWSRLDNRIRSPFDMLRALGMAEKGDDSQSRKRPVSYVFSKNPVFGSRPSFARRRDASGRKVVVYPDVFEDEASVGVSTLDRMDTDDETMKQYTTSDRWKSLAAHTQAGSIAASLPLLTAMGCRISLTLSDSVTHILSDLKPDTLIFQVGVDSTQMMVQRFANLVHGERLIRHLVGSSRVHMISPGFVHKLWKGKTSFEQLMTV